MQKRIIMHPHSRGKEQDEQVHRKKKNLAIYLLIYLKS